MSTPLVWSERPEPNAPSLKDCAYSAMLAALIYGGFTKFPLGIYSVGEREALERSDDQPNETGASLDDLVVAVKRRYNLTVKVNAGGLSGLLATSGLALVVTGSLGNLATGSKLRRWQPGYVGGHAITAITRGDGTVLWLDPLATNKFPGDSALTSDVLAFARSWGGSITVRRDQFAPATGDTVGLTINLAVTHDTNPYDALGTAKVNAATTATKVADGSKVAVAAGLNLGVVQKGTMGAIAIVALNYAGELAVLPLSAVTFTPLTAPVTDCTAAIDAALAPVQAELATTKAQLAKAPELEQERIALAVGAAEAAHIRGI